MNSPAMNCTRPDPHLSWLPFYPVFTTGMIQETPEATSLHKPGSLNLRPMQRPAPSPLQPQSSPDPLVRDETQTNTPSTFIVQLSPTSQYWGWGTGPGGLGLHKKRSIWGPGVATLMCPEAWRWSWGLSALGFPGPEILWGLGLCQTQESCLGGGAGHVGRGHMMPQNLPNPTTACDRRETEARVQNPEEKVTKSLKVRWGGPASFRS